MLVVTGCWRRLRLDTALRSCDAALRQWLLQRHDFAAEAKHMLRYMTILRL
jgi:hypothetical protein